MPNVTQPISTSLAGHVRGLLYLRHVALLALVISSMVASEWLHIRLPWVPVTVVIWLMITTSLWAVWLLHDTRRINATTLLLQLLSDTATLSVLLYYTGGSANPFVSLYLLPVIIAATVLESWRIGAVALFAVACYTALLLLPAPLAASLDLITPGSNAFVCTTTPAAHTHDETGGTLNWHVIGMWTNFLFSTAVITFFIVRMAGDIRQRDRELARAREETLRNERIVALGTLAAGTAHELGTPLSTMAVIIGELADSHPDDTDMQESLALLKTQIRQCKHSISQLAANAGELRPESLQSQAVGAFMHNLLQQWQLIRPQIKPQVASIGPEPEPQLLAEPTLQQALLNLLNNAADASPDAVDITLDWNDDSLFVDICDRGQGIPPEVAADLGKRPIPSNKGQGIGWLLSNATIERFGGTVEWRPREGDTDSGGTCIRVTLPARKAMP